MSTLKPLHAKLILIGGLLLIIGLFMPWYQQSNVIYLNPVAHYEMNAFGGSLVSFLEGERILDPLFYDLSVAYFSIIFALLSILFPFASVRLSEKSQRKWMAIISLLGGVAALANIFYVHFWLGWYYPDGLLFYSDAFTSRGPLIGYFLMWTAAVVLFASTYFSGGLVQKLPVKAEQAETNQKMIRSC